MKTPIIKIEAFTRSGLVALHAGKPKRYYFRLVAANNEIVAQSEAYTTRAKRNKTMRLIAYAKLVMGAK